MTLSVDDLIGSRPAQHTLYRLWDEAGELLYVGMTNNLRHRLTEHRFGQPWFSDVASVTTEEFETREALAEAELRAIRAESPVHNRAGLPSRKPKGVIVAVSGIDPALRAAIDEVAAVECEGKTSQAIRFLIREALAQRREAAARQPLHLF